MQLYTQSKQESNITANTDTISSLKREIQRELLDKAQAERIHAQTMLLPHMQYGPTLNFDSLEWVATFGFDSDGNPLLVGRGNCPQAALNNFNEKWYGNDS